MCCSKILVKSHPILFSLILNENNSKAHFLDCFSVTSLMITGKIIITSL